MAADRLVAIDSPRSPAEEGVRLLERLLALVEQALPDPDDESGRIELEAKIRDYRDALAYSDLRRLRICGEALLVACSGATEGHTRLRAARRAEMTELLTMVRDVTVTLTGESTTTTAEVTAAAARFAALGDIRDLRLLKSRLAKEVIRLRDSAMRREEQWQSKVTSFVQQIESLQGELVATEEEATHDSLTGLANRRLFDRQVAALVRDGSRPFALVLVDVDHFKKINDHHGHEMGDGVLRTIARALVSSVRGEDMVARISGDEFALLLEGVTSSQAAKRVAALMAAVGPALQAVDCPPTSVSCGIAEWIPGDTVAALLKRADDAMYQSKHHGRGEATPNDPL